jgi:tetratricopeptide (TPR) repeat protein
MASAVLLLSPAAAQAPKEDRLSTRAAADEQPRAPILIPNVQEPEEMRVAPFPAHNAVLTPADRMLGEAIEAKGKNDPNGMLPALNRVIASYPEYAPAYVMRLGALCERSDKDAVLSDINNALKFSSTTTETFSETMKQSLGSFYGMRAKIEYLKGDITGAVTDLEKAVQADLTKPTDFVNSGAVSPETTASICTWTQPDVDGLVLRFPADYRPYMFRALYDGFFVFFEKDEQKQDALNRAFADLNTAAKINPSSMLPRLFKAEVFEKAFGLQMMSTYNPRHVELNKTMLSLLNDTIAIDPNNVWALSHRADIYYHLQNWRQAIADYDRVLALDPKDFGNLNDRAEAKLRIGDAYGAISDLSEVISNQEPKLRHSESYERSRYAISYEARADAYMKTQQQDLAIRDLTTAISLYVAQQLGLANINQFRALYPEYTTATDEAIARKLQQTFYPSMSYENFSEGFLHRNGSFGFPDFVVGDLYVKRLDAYLEKGNWHAAKLDFKRAERAYNNPDAVDRWHQIGQSSDAHNYIDMKTFEANGSGSVKLWIKEAKGESDAPGPYQIFRFELNCNAGQLRVMAWATYDASGSLIRSSEGAGRWGSVMPDTLGEVLEHGACGNG